MDFLNAIVALLNFVIVPAIAYGSQLAIGALGVTLIYGILRFSNFAHGDTMAFGAMMTILVTWWMQSVGISLGPLPTALLALPFGILATMALVLVTDRMVYRFYREQKAAIKVAVDILWGRIVADPNDIVHSTASEAAITPSRTTVNPEATMELLRQETRTRWRPSTACRCLADARSGGR